MPFKLTSSAIFLILANAVPIFGVLFWGWDARSILILYWLESVIIGGLNIIKILSIREEQGRVKPFLLSNLGSAAFFTVHFGMFTWVHGAFLKEIFGVDSLLSGLIQGGPIIWTLLSFLISHAFSMFVNFYGKKEYLGRSPNEQMMQPYSRVFVMHLVVLFGGFLVQSFDAPVLAVVLLIALKTLIDLAAHRKEHRTREAVTT